MKLYVKHYINPVTKEIEHTVTSDAPIPSNVGPETQSNSLQPAPIYRKVEEEFEVAEFIRGREMLSLRRANPQTGKIEDNPAAPAQSRAKIKRQDK